MNVEERKRSEHHSQCEKGLVMVVSTDDSVEVAGLSVTEDDTDKITTIICEEQAKEDIYLPDNEELDNDGDLDNEDLENSDLVNDESAKKKFKCPACDQTCSKRSNLRRHIRRLHQSSGDLMKQVSPGLHVTCLLCEHKFSHTVYLKLHLARVHGLEFDEQQITFATTDDFLTWKTELEKRTDSVYVKQTGGKLHGKNGDLVCYFKCNRSGNYRSKVPVTERKRKMKSYGTVKMNSHCTSVIKLVTSLNGEITAFFCATHYGHDGFKECRDLMFQNRYLRKTKRHKKSDNSKMIGSLVEYLNPVENNDPSLSSDEVINDNDPSLLSNEVINDVDQSLTNDQVMNITIETSNDEEMFSSRLCSSADSALSHADANGDVINTDISPEHVYVVDDGIDDDDYTSQFHHTTPKKRFISSLQTLIDVIEKCQTDEVLNTAANSIEELTSRFIPLIDNQNSAHEGIT